MYELLQQHFGILSRNKQSKYSQIYFDQSLLNFILLVKSGRFLWRLTIGLHIRFAICSD